jgi:hypothetical protein
VTDRRKRDGDQRLAVESLDAVKMALQQLTTAQQELAATQKERAEAEARTADALERIAASLERRASAGAAAPMPAEPQASQGAKTEPQTLDLGEKISALRDQGLSYARIANQLNQEGISTPSGRGRWRGTTVQRIVQRQAQSEA